MRTILWLTALLPLLARAQTPPGPGMGAMVKGVVQSINGDLVTVKSDQGAPVQIHVAPSARVEQVVPGQVTDILVGSFVGSGATRDSSGKFTAREVHIFSHSGVNEGQRLMGDAPDHVMTNAAVTQVTPASPGETITLGFGGREQEIYLPPGVPVVEFRPSDRAAVKVGDRVQIEATKGADGGLAAGFVMVAVANAPLP